MARIVYCRFEVWLVSPDPAKGSEIQKTRPCVIISPKEINDYMNTLLIAPLTSMIKKLSFRLNCNFQNHPGQIAFKVKKRKEVLPRSHKDHEEDS